MPEFFASEHFVPLLGDWSTLYPHINIQLDTVKTNAECKKETDLSVVLSSTKPVDENVTELFPIYYIPACSNKLYERLSPLGAEALKTMPLTLTQPAAWVGRSCTAIPAMVTLTKRRPLMLLACDLSAPPSSTFGMPAGSGPAEQAGLQLHPAPSAGTARALRALATAT